MVCVVSHHSTTDVVGCRSAVHDMALVAAVSTAVKALRCGPVSMFFANLAALGSHTHTHTPEQAELNAPANAVGGYRCRHSGWPRRGARNPC